MISDALRHYGLLGCWLKECLLPMLEVDHLYDIPHILLVVIGVA